MIKMLSFSSLAQEVDQSYLLIDSFATLTHRKFSKDLDQVVSRFKDSGVQKVILRSTNGCSSRESLRLCRLYPDTLFCSSGISPHESKQWTDSSEEEIRCLLLNPECVAIGEIGLDFERIFSPKINQIQVFEAILQLSSNIKTLPLVIVVRNAHKEAADLISRYVSEVPFVVIHSFCGTQEDCLRYLSISPNVFIGLSGVISKDKCDVNPLLANGSLPLNRILLSSDSPWNVLNARSSKLSEETKSCFTLNSQSFLQRYCTFQRNEPCSLPSVAELIAAQISGGNTNTNRCSAHEVALQTTFNALKVFQISK